MLRRVVPPAPSFIPLLIVVCAAMVIGILLPRVSVLRVPLMVGEILIGIVVGKSGFGLVPGEPDPWLELMSLFGFTFLMFLSGLEVDFRSLAVSGGGGVGDFSVAPSRPSRRQLLRVCGALFAATLATSTALGFILVGLGHLETPWVLALVMSTTSVGLVMPLLDERGEQSSQFGQVVILSAVIADFVTMLLLTVVVTFYATAGGTLNAIVGFTLLLLTGGGVWAAQRVLRRRTSLVKRLAFAAPKAAEVQVRTAMTLMLLFVVSSQFIGSEIVLGAFLAGTAVRSLSPRSVQGLLRTKLDAIGFGFFIPIFFIRVGADFDLQGLLRDRSSWVLVPLLLTFAFLVKVVPSAMLIRVFGARNAVAAGFLLSSRLSLPIAASAIGLRLGLVAPELNTAIIAVALVSCVASPAIYGAMRPSPVKGRAASEPRALANDDRIGPSGLDLQLIEVQSLDFPFLANRTLAEGRLRQRTGLTLVGVYRADGAFVESPGSHFEVTDADRLVLIGNEQQVAKLEALGERRSHFPPPV